MSRPDAPFGFRPIRRLDNAPMTSPNTYYVTGSNSALFIGDPVTKTAIGNASAIQCVDGLFKEGRLQGVTLATAGTGNKIVGVVQSVVPVTADSLAYRANATDRVLKVYDDPMLMFAVQVDDVLPSTAIGSTTNIVLDTAGNAFTGISGAELDASINGGATYQCLIHAILDREDNVVNTAGNIALITFNLHQNTTGVGQAGT